MYWPFIIRRQIKRVPLTPGDLLVKSKLSPLSGSVALRQLKLIHKVSFSNILQVDDLGGNWFNLHFSFFKPDPKIKIFFKKGRVAEQSNEIGRTCLLFFVVVWPLKKNSFSICYLAAPQQTFGYYQGDSHCFTAFWQSWLAGCQELCNEVG